MTDTDALKPCRLPVFTGADRVAFEEMLTVLDHICDAGTIVADGDGEGFASDVLTRFANAFGLDGDNFVESYAAHCRRTPPISGDMVERAKELTEEFEKLGDGFSAQRMRLLTDQIAALSPPNSVLVEARDALQRAKDRVDSLETDHGVVHWPEHGDTFDDDIGATLAKLNEQIGEG